MTGAMVGEHTDVILRDLLGLDGQDIERLRQSAVA